MMQFGMILRLRLNSFLFIKIEFRNKALVMKRVFDFIINPLALSVSTQVNISEVIY